MPGSTHVPKGWPTVAPRILVDDPEGLVRFIQTVFEATGDYNAERPTELAIGDSMIMISGSIEREIATAFLYIYVRDTDSTYASARANGAISIEEPSDMPYGDRRAMVKDGWGNTWQIATHGGKFTP
jgi:PhnB protein